MPAWAVPSLNGGGDAEGGRGHADLDSGATADSQEDPAAEFSEEGPGDLLADSPHATYLKRFDFGREFQDYPIPATRLRSSNTKKTPDTEQF
jgi:hypothetical protein